MICLFKDFIKRFTYHQYLLLNLFVLFSLSNLLSYLIFLVTSFSYENEQLLKLDIKQVMSTKVRTNIPPRSYAVKKDKPKLLQAVEQTLTNKYGVEALEFHQEETHIDTYYIHSKDTYYQGNWMGGLPHGKGRAIYPDGSYYIGKFEEGEAEDQRGIVIFPNGAIYEGNVKKSKLQGRGKLVHKMAYIYEGEWHNNKPYGEGHQTCPTANTQYIGQFVDGLKHCFDSTRDIKQKKKQPPQKMAIYKRGNEVYRGQFAKGLMHGYGELTNEQKKLKYCGEFINGKKEGYGTLETEQGKLTGNFHNDVINGNGIFQWWDGRTYEGQFKNSQFDGEGRITFPEGNALVGTWRNGQSQSLKAVFGTKMQHAENDILNMFTSVKKENSVKQSQGGSYGQNQFKGAGKPAYGEKAYEENGYKKSNFGVNESQTRPIDKYQPDQPRYHNVGNSAAYQQNYSGYKQPEATPGNGGGSGYKQNGNRIFFQQNNEGIVKTQSGIRQGRSNEYKGLDYA